MTGFYTRAEDTARRLLTKFGRPWLFTTTENDGSITSRSAVAAFIETVKHQLADSGVSIGDKKFIVAVDAAPRNGDRMTHDDQSFVVVWSDPIGDTPCAYYVWGRSG
jgi:hypothetical protein